MKKDDLKDCTVIKMIIHKDKTPDLEIESFDENGKEKQDMDTRAVIASGASLMGAGLQTLDGSIENTVKQAEESKIPGIATGLKNNMQEDALLPIFRFLDLNSKVLKNIDIVGKLKVFVNECDFDSEKYSMTAAKQSIMGLKSILEALSKNKKDD